MNNFFRKIFPAQAHVPSEEELEDLQWYLYQAENLFFESSFGHSLKPEHRKSLLITLRMFCDVKESNKINNKFFVYNFASKLYRYSDDELNEHINKYPGVEIFNLFVDLPEKSKVGILLIVNCILLIDKNARNDEKQLVSTIYQNMGMTKIFWNEFMKQMKNEHNNKWFNYIHNSSLK